MSNKKQEEKINQKINETIDEKASKEVLEKDSLSELEETKQKCEECMDKLKRNMAEFDNYKKRNEKEKSMLYTSVLCDILEPLLLIVDNFEKSMNAECKDKEYKEGISMIHKDLIDILNKFGLEEIENVNFNPELHEAVMHETDDKKDENIIGEVFRKGYKVNDKIIRHSMVKVIN
ncbi:MAG: nucleotide exchange factor GrpE [Clostridia bacterium]